MQESKNTFACFVDFKKAFDYINRDLLGYKLSHSGIVGKLMSSD